ncbi:protein-disulfide reductase DsbD family protein [Phenylobacterium sp.]|jgi:thiol:disulfide interchange protein|uniref:protein-disulfide reductase DsbD family protein n=1 Tax=Phenylobacterium sp. TaxID=1871053 RepID=UPI003784B1D6
MRRILAGLAAALALTGASVAAPVDTGHVEAELVAAASGVTPGGSVRIALRQKIDEGWHTYWRNPGDSGEATRLALTLPGGWSASPFTWPTPKRLPVGPLVNYGYEGEVLLPMTLTAPAAAKVGETVSLRGKADFLVCEEICIPESADLSLDVPVVAGPAPADRRWGPAIATALAAAPKPARLTAAYQPAGATLTLAVAGAPLQGTDGAGAYFFPATPGMLDHAAVQAIERGPQGLTLTLTPGDDFKAAAAPPALEGVLSVGGRAYEIAAAAGPAPAGARGLGPPPRAAAAGGLGLPLALAFAVLGGLVLNLMPCVFPILAMKAASLVGHGREARAARLQGLAFGAGVLATFVLLAGVLIALKAAGAAVGWGFQLQSPPVVAGLALLMLAVALNLSGVFEIGASLQDAGSGLAARGGAAGAFFTGALAVVVATPCTAPFMAPALGWALVQPPAASLAVFLALGAGFAAPFVALAFAPGLLARLPKPGPWMDAFRKALAFPMYAAAAWLVWVLAQQAGPDGLARVLGAGVVLAAAAWLYGAAQRRLLAGGRPAAPATGSALFAVLALAAALWPGYAAPPLAGTAPASAKVPFEPYSAERLAALRAEGRPVFVNFTAAWCVSCQVNERVALSGAKVAQALGANNVAYLKADWTRKDAVIAAELARHGRAGVPLYLVYRPGAAEPQILPNILTEGAVVRALEASRS